jgi:hypothetical protein
MVLLLRGLARIVAFVLLTALALAGLSVAIFSIQGNDGPLSLPGLARHISLPDLRESAGNFLADLEADGPTARVSAIAGAGAIFGGILLLTGALAPRRERLVILDEEDGEKIAARRGALVDIAETLTEQGRGVSEAKARVRPKRDGRGGRLRVAASHPRRESAAQVEERALRRLSPLTEPFELKARVDARTGKGKARVQ